MDPPEPHRSRNRRAAPPHGLSGGDRDRQKNGARALGTAPAWRPVGTGRSATNDSAQLVALAVLTLQTCYAFDDLDAVAAPDLAPVEAPLGTVVGDGEEQEPPPADLVPQLGAAQAEAP